MTENREKKKTNIGTNLFEEILKQYNQLQRLFVMQLEKCRIYESNIDVDLYLTDEQKERILQIDREISEKNIDHAQNLAKIHEEWKNIIPDR
jgi:intergrase/recombinase